MTRPSKSSLVLDGNDIKYRLQAERLETKTFVHIDWLRFTCNIKNQPLPPAEIHHSEMFNYSHDEYELLKIRRLIAVLPDEEYCPAYQALDLANEICNILGEDFIVFKEIRKGYDFYKFRWSIERNGVECGWVGFLSSGDSPRQASQAKTIHANIYGSACTFAKSGWNIEMAKIIDYRKANITRTDLALDFFDGFEGGISKVADDYKNGLCDVFGRRLKANCVGDWLNGNSRSLYFGSKEAGKQTNVYEKGHQLFGVDSGSDWIRIELRYGNKLRLLCSDILRRPSDFFGGASDWHESMLFLSGQFFVPEKINVLPRLAIETVAAEVVRNIKWALNTAAPTIAVAFHYLGDGFLELCTNKVLPGRLQKFSKSELKRAFDSIYFSEKGVRHSFAIP